MRLRRAIIFSICTIPVLCGILLWTSLADNNLVPDFCLWAIWPLGDWLLEGNTPNIYWPLIGVAKGFFWGFIVEFFFATSKSIWSANEFHSVISNGQQEIQTPAHLPVTFAGLACFACFFLTVESARFLETKTIYLVPVLASFTTLHFSRIMPETAKAIRIIYLLLLSCLLFACALILFVAAFCILMLLSRNHLAWATPLYGNPVFY